MPDSASTESVGTESVSREPASIGPATTESGNTVSNGAATDAVLTDAAAGSAGAPVIEATSADFELGRAALLEITTADTIGANAGSVSEGDGVVSVHFETTLAGYPGWHWTVSVAHVDGAASSVLETELLPGAGALLAPDWVPWVDRLADYRAAQDAAGVDGGESEEEPDIDVDDDDDDELDNDILHGGDLDGVDIDDLDEADEGSDESDDDDDDAGDDADEADDGDTGDSDDSDHGDDEPRSRSRRSRR